MVRTPFIHRMSHMASRWASCAKLEPPGGCRIGCNPPLAFFLHFFSCYLHRLVIFCMIFGVVGPFVLWLIPNKHTWKKWLPNPVLLVVGGLYAGVNFTCITIYVSGFSLQICNARCCWPTQTGTVVNSYARSVDRSLTADLDPLQAHNRARVPRRSGSPLQEMV